MVVEEARVLQCACTEFKTKYLFLDSAVPANLVDGTEQVDESLVRHIRHG
jgi:hypothetical protein